MDEENKIKEDFYTRAMPEVIKILGETQEDWAIKNSILEINIEINK